jgi:uncharacterized protein YndB with AHSA1/START domain
MSDIIEEGAEVRELVLHRRLDAPRDAVWRCWTEPDLLTRWFTPAPWTTHDPVIELRTGGAFNTLMKGPNGESHLNVGVFLEIAPLERLVFTDAYASGWAPSAKPFFTGIVMFADDGGGTDYTARARHWTAEDCAAHGAMGFHDGWGKAADQLETLARSL